MKRQFAMFYLSTFVFYYIGWASKSNAFSIQGRPLAAGDTFTPKELLPIASKLLEKVSDPGIGKGFVSSTRNAQELSDKLFEAFFLTNKRIVTLTDYDITSIDALQALALSGEDFVPVEETSTKGRKTKFLRGQFVEVPSEPKKSQYKLITKTSDQKINKAKRRDNAVMEGLEIITAILRKMGISLAKKLGKTRKLIVNKRRNNSKKGKENVKSRVSKEKRTCRWNYICDNVADLDSCRLKANCGQENLNTKINDIDFVHKSDEHTLAIIRFRKMLGISLVDEEVEKILESRNLHLHVDSKDVLNRVETLSENFNNIIVHERLESTTPLTSQKGKNKEAKNIKKKILKQKMMRN